MSSDTAENREAKQHLNFRGFCTTGAAVGRPFTRSGRSSELPSSNMSINSTSDYDDRTVEAPECSAPRGQPPFPKFFLTRDG